jgi:hypothetical protein
MATNDDGDDPFTCFEGVVKSSSGVASLTYDPSFCVSGIASFDVR